MLELGWYCWTYAGTDKEMNKVKPTIIMFLKLALCPYCKVDKPNATIKAHVKHSTEAAKASGIDARSAPIFPAELENLRNYQDEHKTWNGES